MLIVATSISAFWPDNRELPVVLTNKNCIRYIDQKKFEEFNYISAVHPWYTSTGMQQSAVAIDKYYSFALEWLAYELNAYHHTHYPKQFWELITGNWLELLTAIVYERYQLLSQAKQQGGSQIKAGEYSLAKLRQNFSSDLSELASNEHWNQAIFQRIAGLMGIDVIPHDCDLEFQLPVKVSSKKEKCLRYVSRLIAGDKITFSRSQFSIRQLAKIALNLRTIPFVETNLLPETGRKNVRSAFSDAVERAEGDDFGKLLLSLVSDCLPLSFKENFKSIESFIQQTYPTNSRVIHTATSHMVNDCFTIWAAKQRLNGSRLIISQHGGCYGISKFTQAEKFEQRICDLYCNWGWENKVKRSIPMPAIRLNRFAVNANREKLAAVNWVWFDNPRYSYWCQSFPIADKIDEYFTQQFELFDRCSAALQTQLKIKLYPSEVGQDTKERIKQHSEHMYHNILQNLTLTESLEQAGLCLCTYNGTTFLETFASNYPTLLFWQPGHFELRDEVQDYFLRLKEVGIYHDNVESCVKKLEEVYQDPLSWWHSAEVQNLVRECAQVFSYTSGSHIQEWSNLFQQQIDAAGLKS